MAFVFGINIPVIEVFLISSMFTIVLFIVLIIISYQIHKVNKNFGKLMVEEHEIKKELDQTLHEEAEQLRMMKGVIQELSYIEELLKSNKRKVRGVKGTFEKIDFSKVTKNQEKFLVAMDKIGMKLSELEKDNDHQQQLMKAFMQKVK